MRKQAFDRKLEQLEALRSDPDPAGVREHLRKALTDRSNLVVSRAAALVDELHSEDLIPDLLVAFDRFFVDPEKTDPLCFAKEAIAKALRGLAHHDGETYVRGIAHFQYEPIWGGRADTAAALRSTCALALSECPWDPIEILGHLADGLADPEATMRVNTAVALDQMGRREGALLLRLKLLLGDAAPDVMRQCFASYLSLAPDGAVAFIARFLKSADQDVQLEAACALAQSRDPDSIAVLREFWQDLGISARMRQAILISLGASPLEQAAAFLVHAIQSSPYELAATAMHAVTSSRFRAELRKQIETAVAARADPKLTKLFVEAFGRARASK